MIKNGLRKKKVALPFSDDPLWYKDAVIYQVHVKSMFDSNDDGIGDFPGLIEKLDYITDLGVNTIWLLPFYPSPRRDDGYDISEYRGVHPDYGSLNDARRFIDEAHARGLRVITELVINHTSDQHPWFQRARKAKPGSSARDFYVWSDTDQKFTDTRIIFLDTEKSNWTWDPVAGAYFWHRFYSHQPDLNFDNPRVLKAVLSVMNFWLELGVDGLRLDAVPYLVEREGTNCENLPETHAILKLIRAEIDRSFPGRMLLAEANMWPEDVQQYFGSVEGGVGDECHMAFHFPLMPRMYMALAQEDRFPITDILRQTPDIPPNCQWAVFLRNHDELTLEMVTDKERDYLWNTYAADRRARINLGIRRRLAPLMQNDRRRIELLNSLLLSMPGTPVIYYGDEIGMGDNIHLGDRDGVRTPMQWSPDRNGGFSRADPADMVLPAIMDPLYGFQSINVEAQTRNAHSLLNWTRRMLSVRGQQKAFGRGTLKLLYPANRRVLAYLREYTGPDGVTETILCVANVSRAAQPVDLDLIGFDGRIPVEMIDGSVFPVIGKAPYSLTLQGYSFFWFVLAAEAQMPAWHSPKQEPLPDFHTFVVRSSAVELLKEPSRSLLENTVLPAYLPKRRWFGAKDEVLESVRIATAEALLTPGKPTILLAEIIAGTARGESRYLMPLSFVAEDDLVSELPQQLALSRLRRGRQVGYLTDAFALDTFAWRILELLRNEAVLPAAGGELRFVPTSKLKELDLAENGEIRRLTAEQSNSSLIIEDKAILKVIRRISGGEHPEAEMGRYLTERGFPNIAPLLGEVTRFEGDVPHVLIVVQGFMHNQGDAWTWTLNMLERAIQDLALPEGTPGSDSIFDDIGNAAETLGRRLGEMHVVLASPTDNADFSPMIADEVDCASWASDVKAQLDRSLALLEQRSGKLTEELQALLVRLQARRAALPAVITRLAAAGSGSLRTRAHGDLHLGQILVAQNDIYFIDFEGEPARPLQERRAKTSPLRDVAGIIRSFDYAAGNSASGAVSQTSDAAIDRKQAVYARFRELTETRFRSAYSAAAAPIAHHWKIMDAERALTDLFLLEKAAYEVAYEIANRPTWLAVPLRGLVELVERLTLE